MSAEETTELSGPDFAAGVSLGEITDGAMLAGHVRDVLCDPGVGGGLLNPEEVASLVDTHQGGRADNSARLWALLFLEHWRTEASSQATHLKAA